MRSAKARYLSLAACALLLLATGLPWMAELPLAGFRESGDPARLNGVWRSRGYGWLWRIRNGRVEAYDETPRFCMKAAAIADFDHLRNSARIADDGLTITVALGDPAFRYTFDKIDSLPDHCSRGRKDDPLSVVDAMVEIFTRHYTFFDRRKVDWTALSDTARKKVREDTTDTELYEILGALISPFDDDHVSLFARTDGRERIYNTGAGRTLAALAAEARRDKLSFNDLLEAWKDRVWSRHVRQSLFRGEGRDAAGGLIRYGLMDGDIGLLSIAAMEGYAGDEKEERAAVDKVMDDAMALFEGAKAIIVDVSLNDGGYDSVARQISARFVSERTFAYSKHAGDAMGEWPQRFYVEPGEGRRFTGPVYLLTSDVTVSAAEIFTLCMRALPNVTHVGQATRGSLSDQLWKQLPNRWWVSLSNEVYLDARGKLWEATGIPPQIEFEVFGQDDAAAAYLRSILKVVTLVRSQSRSRASQEDLKLPER